MQHPQDVGTTHSNSKPKASEAGSLLREAALAEYASLRDEHRVRVELQAKVLGWFLALTGGLLGSILSWEPSSTAVPTGIKRTLLSALFHQIEPGELAILAIILAAYAFAVELLLANWIYQVRMIFRLAISVEEIEARLISVFHLPTDETLFGSRSKQKELAVHTNSRLVFFAVKISGLLQVLSLYTMSLVAIILGFAVTCSLRVDGSPQFHIVAIVLLALSVVLTGGWLTCLFIHIALHSWFHAEPMPSTILRFGGWRRHTRERF